MSILDHNFALPGMSVTVRGVSGEGVVVFASVQSGELVLKLRP